MKKYIRTKDGIYEREQTLPTGTIFNADCLYTDNELIYDVQTGFGIIAQADTIEELCEEFVVAYEDGARIVYGDLEWAKTKAKASLEFGNKSVIYGAIWTDKGLIYVAKMNDKGELELL